MNAYSLTQPNTELRRNLSSYKNYKNYKQGYNQIFEVNSQEEESDAPQNDNEQEYLLIQLPEQYETITSLKTQLQVKDETIASLENQPRATDISPQEQILKKPKLIYLGYLFFALLGTFLGFLLAAIYNYTQKEDLESDPDFNPDNHKNQDDLTQVIQPTPEEQSNSQAKPPLLNLT